MRVVQASAVLREKIEHEIRDRGPLPFSRYMEICLYDPELGYYSRNAEQFGKAGDFYTSSDVHAVFGRLMARQFEEMWRAVDRPAQIEILELGPGRGLFARDVLDWTRKKFPDFFSAVHYTLQESSPALRARLAENLAAYIQQGKVALNQAPEGRPSIAQRFSAGSEPQIGQVPERRPIQILRSTPPETPIIIFANEFFDALPVEVLSSRGKLHLAIDNGQLHEVWFPPSSSELEFLDRYSVHPEPGDRIEISLLVQQSTAHIADAVQRGFLLIFDYGYTRAEQLAGRFRGTLMTYRRHSASPNPYEVPGEQDITAHVNFTALAAAAEDAGLSVQKLLTQSQVLMGIGQANQFADAFEDCRLPQERAKVALQLKHLISPVGMGETFRVMLASLGVEQARVAGLSGLSFAA